MSPSRPGTLNLCKPTRRAKAQTALENYYRIFFALFRGDVHRPALPFELVISIIRHAELNFPCPSKSLSVLHTGETPLRMFTCTKGLRVPFPKLVPVLKTVPLPKDGLGAIGKIEVVVKLTRDSRYRVSVPPVI